MIRPPRNTEAANMEARLSENIALPAWESACPRWAGEISAMRTQATARAFGSRLFNRSAPQFG